MSDCNVTARDLASLAERLDTRINGLRELLDERDRLTRVALEKAEQTMTLRLEGMNEFRAQIINERGTFTPRMLHEADKELLAVRLSVLEKWHNMSQGRTSVSNIVSFLALMIAGATLILKFATP